MLIVLWISIAIMLLSIVMPKKIIYRRLITSTGWIIFAIYWLFQPLHYLEIGDYVNVILVLALSALSFMIAYRLMLQYKSNYMPRHNEIDITYMATRAVAVGCIVYFPFAEISTLGNLLIITVTSNTTWVLNSLHIPVVRSGNMIIYNEHTVEIILACTAIESIALFIGIITSVKASIIRMTAAFVVSVPVIYILNIIRDVFVVVAYGRSWFGPNSFEIAHHMIAKAGSGIALFIIAYVVMRILPEIVQLIDGLWNLTVQNMQYLKNIALGKN